MYNSKLKYNMEQCINIYIRFTLYKYNILIQYYRIYIYIWHTYIIK